MFKCKKCGNFSISPSIKCSHCFTPGTLELTINPQKMLPKLASEKEFTTISTGFNNVDNLIGGGARTSSIKFMAASPGVEKSTFCFQLSAYQKMTGKKIYYFTREETNELIKARAERIGISDFLLQIFFNKDIREISDIVRCDPPNVLIIDSIQSTIGSNEYRLSTIALSTVMLQLRKITNMYGISTWIIGQVNKDLKFSGPQSLSHYCDVFIEVKKGLNSEVVFSTPEKNRFGATDKRAIFRMTEKGLIEKSEEETGYILRHSLPSIIGVSAFVLKTANDFTTDEITVTTNQKNKNVLVGSSNNHAVFLTTIINQYFEDFEPGFIVRANQADKIPKYADLAILIGILSVFYKKPIPRTMAFIASIDGSGRLLPTPEMDSMVKRAKVQGYSCVFGASPIGSQTASWEIADSISNVWKKLGF